MNSHLQLQVVDSLRNLDALSVEWHTLPGADLSPLLSHAWHSAAARSLHPDARLAVITVWQDSQLAGLAPLVERRRGPVKWLEFIGSRALYEPCDFLYRDTRALDALVHHILARRQPLALQRIPAGGPLARAVTAAHRGRLVCIHGAPCNRVDARGTWQDYLAGRSAQCRAGFPRKRRHLEAHGPARVEFVTPAPGQADSWLEEFMKVEAASWKSTSGSSLTQRPALQAFFRDASRRFAARGALRVHLLRVGDQIVAMQWLIEQGGRLWELKTAYDERWSRASPGRLLIWATLRDAFDRGITAYEFLGAGDGQQAAWTTHAEPLDTLVWYPYSWIGMAAGGFDATRSLLRHALGSA